MISLVVEMRTKIVQVKTFDIMVRKLKEVRYIPVTRKYLIFVSTLEAKAIGLRSKMA